MRVHVSDVTATVLSNAPPGQFRIIPRGEVALKGKGESARVVEGNWDERVGMFPRCNPVSWDG